MKQYNAKNIRNVVLLGHSSSGKTSLAEAAYYLSGASDRLGKVADGNTVSDFDPEEIKRGASVSTSIIPLEWKDCKINLLDTPGLFDFSGGVSEGVRAADSAVILLSAKSGVAVGTEKGYLAASKKGIAKIFFVNEMDNEHADYYKVFGELKENFGAGVCPIVVPYVENHVVKCYVNLIENKAYTYNAKGVATEVPVPSFSHVDELRDAINEAVAETSEELMEKYFGGEEFTQEELVNGLSQGVHNGEISPIFCGSATTLEGVDQLINGLTWLAPSADIAAPEVATAADGSKVELKTDENEKTVIVVFKSIDDQFGKLQYFKVVSGKVTPDSVLINSRTGASEKFSKLLYITGKKQENAECIPAGDIGAVSKLNSTNTGDTLADGKQGLTLPGVNYELSGLSMAIFPANKGDEEKIFAGLARIHEEDPTISYYTNAETRETIVSGMGEQHLDLVVSKLKSKFRVDVILQVPKVAYRETIRKKVKVQGKHKKQSGGKGQYGDVWVEFEPWDCEGLVFEEKVVGGAVPKNYFPAVEKGLIEASQKGMIAGFPMVGLKATLVDGSYHPVDSSEMAFKIAASLAYKAGVVQANPVILEPIGTLKAYVPGANTGDIMGDITKRRGRVNGMTPSEDKLTCIEAEVPMGEMGDFATMLRSTTQGRGWYTIEFARYEEAPGNVAQKVKETYKREDDE